MQSGKGVVHLTELESGDYKSICENLYDGIHITDGTGTILFINKAYTRTTGILPEELLGRKVSEIEAEGILYTGSVTERVLAQGKRINSVATIHRLNKEVLVTGTPVFDEEKNIRLVVTNTRDFPELKRLEAQLLALEEKQEKAVQELAYLRSQQAGDKQTIYHSAAMREVMEIVRKVAPTDVTVLITGESGTGKELIANEIYQNSDRCGKPFIKLNCAAIPAELLESELFGYEEGAFTGAKRTGKAGMFELANTGVLLLDEVGDMPMALQAKLLRAVSHDLRTPLTNINGSVGILMGKDQTLKPEVREQLYTAIDDDTNWLINMTENLLAATQLETDRTKLKTAPELLEDLFQSAVRQLDRRARDHHISVDLEDQTLMASMNAGMIQRVIINMMNNAIQYTPKDSHIILSGTRRKDWVEISVSDDGPGIPDEAKKHLFDLFYTAEQGKPDSKRGLGLGLHLCQSIVNAHGGTITVSDHAPSGTTFRFTLPAVRTDGVK